MAKLKLSDLSPEDIQPVSTSALKLSDLSPDDVQPTVQPSVEQAPSAPAWSKTESAGQGVLQSITGGFSDELGGALGALQEKLLGNPDNKSLQDLYQEYRDMHRGRNKEADEINPGSYLAGNVAGGVAGGVLAPAALAAKGASVAGAAGMGALTGLGTSESDVVSKEALQDIAVGGGLGAAGGLLGKGLQKVLSPKSLEKVSEKAASEAVGIKPSKELTTAYNSETGKLMRGSDITKGIGKTGLDEGALPLTGGPQAIYDKSLEAIESNYNKLTPVIEQTQQKLNQNLPKYLEASGTIKDKYVSFIQQFSEELDKNPDKANIMSKITSKYEPYVEQILKGDGDLNQLIQYKRVVQDYATDLAATAYNQPASDLKPEAEFVKRFGGILRQHIEDVASAADPNAGKSINQVNKTLGNLFAYRDAAKKLLDKSEGHIGVKDAAAGGLGFIFGGPTGAVAVPAAKLAIEKTTGHTLNRLGNIATAKVAKTASKAVQTPAGELTSKAVSSTPLATVTNPFTQSRIQEKYNPSDASKIATNLYTADDDSLRQVASALNKNPGLKYYADHLTKAIDSNDSGEKNRAIFLILQNPQSRKLVTPEKDQTQDGIKGLRKDLEK